MNFHLELSSFHPFDTTFSLHRTPMPTKKVLTIIAQNNVTKGKIQCNIKIKRKYLIRNTFTRMASIGKIIEKVLREKRIPVAEFADKINTNRNNVYNIFTRKSLDTALLNKIGQVLDHDFFQYYSKNTEVLKLKESKQAYSLTAENKLLQKRIQELEKENRLLLERLRDKERIIELLEGRRK